MTSHRLYSCFALSLCALAATLVSGCNLDLDDLLDEPDMGSSSGEDTGGGDDDDDHGDDDHGDDDHGDDGAADDSGDDGAAQDGGDDGDAPAELLGAWVAGDDTSAILVELHDDGSFSQALYYAYDDEGCATEGQEAYEGTYTLDDDALVLTATSGVQVIDRCGTLEQGEAIADEVALAWSLGSDDIGDVLTLDDGTGALDFHRADVEPDDGADAGQ